jgi:hypothetical protein
VTSPATELRTAAEKLRDLADAVTRDIATNPYWTSTDHPPHDYPNLYARGVDNGLGGPAGEFAAAMGPNVGLAIADWLDQAAANAAALTWPNDFIESALAVARAINGGQQ